ncbi:MAG: hypothetical protein ABI758_00350 [Candidatus Woesebacteria bacterium]
MAIVVAELRLLDRGVPVSLIQYTNSSLIIGFEYDQQGNLSAEPYIWNGRQVDQALELYQGTWTVFDAAWVEPEDDFLQVIGRLTDDEFPFEYMMATETLEDAQLAVQILNLYDQAGKTPGKVFELFREQRGMGYSGLPEEPINNDAFLKMAHAECFPHVKPSSPRHLWNFLRKWLGYTA